MSKCPRCGEEIVAEATGFRCPCCGASFTEDSFRTEEETLRRILDVSARESLSNRRHLLWAATHEKYPSKENVIQAAKEVLFFHAEDFLASVYLRSYDPDPTELSALLASSKVHKALAEEALRWLLPLLSPRMIGSLGDFISRHYEGEERRNRLIDLQEAANKIANGIYTPDLPRDVYLGYSPADMPKVIEIMDELERNGFVCFAKFRNMRCEEQDEEGAIETIKAAMTACEVYVFLSSDASRLVDCEAMAKEIPYLSSELLDKPRVEYLLQDYGNVPFMVRKALKKAFPEQEYCTHIEDLIDRVASAIEAKDRRMLDSERLKQAIEEEQAKHIEAVEKAKKDAELERIRLETEKKALEEEHRRLLEAEEQERLREQKRKYAPRVENGRLYYGWYPQSKADPLIVPDLKTRGKEPSGYVKYGDDLYAKRKTDFYFVEPIRWKPLLFKDGIVLAIAEMGLERRWFDLNSAEFATSAIREWLNGQFLQKAFPDGGLSFLAQDGDKLSLPSKEDLMNPSFGFSFGEKEDKNRVCLLSAYSSEESYAEAGPYLTKTRYPDKPNEVYRVNYDGTLGNSNIATEDNGIRPIAWLRLSPEQCEALRKK